MLRASLAVVMSTLAIYAGVSSAQDDRVTLTIGESCDTIPRLSIPVYMDNPDSVGSFTVRIILSDFNPPDPMWLVFDPEDDGPVDTTGSRINYWPFFSYYIDEPDTIVVNAARILYDEVHSLPPGSGLIFTIHPVITETANTCQRLRYGDGCFVYDENLWNYYPIDYERGEVCSGCDPSWLHGDIDHSGNIALPDVIGLIGAYRGDVFFCTGCVCTGDADGNGIPVQLSDVIAIIGNYRTGQPVMLPCEEVLIK
jgi:hypothetical protein